jgi:N4-gp56 family major capsid protein
MGIIISTSSGITNQYQKYFDKNLLARAVNTLRLNDFARKTNLPMHAGSKQVAWQRWGAAASSNVSTMVEGTALSTFSDMSFTQVTATLAQYAEAVKFSDILEATELFNILDAATERMGEDFALNADDQTRAVLCNGSTAATERFAQQITSFSNLSSAATTAAFVDSQDILDAATNLKNNLAPTFGGSYVGVLPPNCTRDLMRDPDWLAAKEYSDVAGLYKGEVGSLYGVRIVEATNPWREQNGTQYAYSATGPVYVSLILGQDAVGVTTLAGQSPWAPKFIVNRAPSINDPVQNFTTAGVKCYFASAALNQNFVVALRSKTRFV